MYLLFKNFDHFFALHINKNLRPFFVQVKPAVVKVLRFHWFWINNQRKIRKIHFLTKISKTIVDFNCIKINLFIVDADYDVRYADIVYFTFKGGWSVFSCIRTEYGDLRRKSCIQSNTTGKYGTEINPYFDTFHKYCCTAEIFPISPNRWYAFPQYDDGPLIFSIIFVFSLMFGWFLDRPRIILGIDWWVVTYFQNIFMGHKFVFFLVFRDFPWHFVLFWKSTKICTIKY